MPATLRGDTKGCIVVGFYPTSATDAWIGGSRLAESALFASVAPLIRRGTDVHVEVVGPTLRQGAGGRDGSALDGAAVRVLQRWLRMPDEHRTGYLGPITEAAVRAVQRRHGLEVDGVAGPRTWLALGQLPNAA